MRTTLPRTVAVLAVTTALGSVGPTTAQDATAEGATGYHYQGVPSRILDGQTFAIADLDVVVRLWGIEVPPTTTANGAAAQNELARRIAASEIACVPVTDLMPWLAVYRDATDQRRCANGSAGARRIVGVCRRVADDADLAEAMVRAGYARDDPQRSCGTYATHEAAARAAQDGLWRDDNGTWGRR